MTRFEQARGRPKPPPTWFPEMKRYQPKHSTWAIWRMSNGGWLAVEPSGHHYTQHPTWEQAMAWVEGQVKRGR